MANHEVVAASIAGERQRQIDKWGDEAYHFEGKQWAEILGEEYGEVCRAKLETGPWSLTLYEELIHTATVASFWAEEILKVGEELNGTNQG